MQERNINLTRTKKSKKSLCIFFALSLSFSLITTNTKAQAQQGQTPVETASQTPTQSPSQANAAKDNSKKNGGQGMLSQIANVAMGGAMMQQFAASCTPTAASCVWPYLAMGLLSFANAGASGGATGKSFDASGQLDFCPECFNGMPGQTDYTPGSYDSFNLNGLDPSTPLSTGPYKTVGELQTAMNNLKDQVDKSGYKIDIPNQKIVSPEGKETTFADVNSMVTQGTGLSAEEFASVKDGLSKAQEKLAADFNVASTGFDSGGGAGGGTGSKYKFDSMDMDSSLDSYLKKLQQNRKPAAVAGMKKLINGNEAIGVAGDNIFDMVHRRYQHKRKSNVFIEHLTPEKSPK